MMSLKTVLMSSLIAAVVTMAMRQPDTTTAEARERSLSEREQANTEKEALRMQVARSMELFEQFKGEWEGSLAGTQPDGSAFSIPIRWNTAKVFEGRWVRFEFTSIDEVAPGRYVEWEGLFTVNGETGDVESIWMTPQLRVAAATSRFLDGRLIFFEKGHWDASGRVLTMIAHKQNEGPEQPEVEVKSTFTIAADGKSFTVIDEEKQDDGSYTTVGTFTLRRAGS